MAKKIDLSAMASKGGKQAAANMTPEERKQRASAAAEARWGAVPQAHCQGSIKIGAIEIPCAVLEDKKTRLLTQRGMFVSLGRNKNPTTRYSAIDGKPGFLAANNLDPFISDELRRSRPSLRRANSVRRRVPRRQYLNFVSDGRFSYQAVIPYQSPSVTPNCDGVESIPLTRTGE